jgi:hypothetical protein
LFQRHTKNIILGSAPGLVMTVGDDSEDWSLGKMMWEIESRIGNIEIGGCFRRNRRYGVSWESLRGWVGVLVVNW